MKRVLMIALGFGISIVLYAGCSESGGDGDDSSLDGNGNGGGTSQGASVYMPFKQGALWEYNETETDYDTGKTTTDTGEMICTGQEAFGGKTYWELWEDNEPMYLRIEGNDVYGYGIYDDVFDKPALNAIGKAAAEDEVLFWRFGVSAGTTWNIWSTSISENGGSATATVTGLFYGIEAVNTDAGNYPDCARIVMTFTATFMYTMEGVTVSSTSSEVTNIWFAPNVGPVKIMATEREDGELAYDRTSVLAEYDPDAGATAPGTPSGNYTLSGSIKTEDNTAIPGVTITIIGSSGNQYTLYTDTEGVYGHLGVPSGTYIITPAMVGYLFTPPYQSIAVQEHTVVPAFIGTMAGDGNGEGSYQVSGRIVTPTGSPVAGATVILASSGSTGQTATTITDSNGEYTFDTISAGDYLVSVYNSIYTFIPPYQAIQVSGDMSIDDFIGTPILVQL